MLGPVSETWSPSCDNAGRHQNHSEVRSNGEYLGYRRCCTQKELTHISQSGFSWEWFGILSKPGHLYSFRLPVWLCSLSFLGTLPHPPWCDETKEALTRGQTQLAAASWISASEMVLIWTSFLQEPDLGVSALTS